MCIQDWLLLSYFEVGRLIELHLRLPVLIRLLATVLVISVLSRIFHCEGHDVSRAISRLRVWTHGLDWARVGHFLSLRHVCIEGGCVKCILVLLVVFRRHGLVRHGSGHHAHILLLLVSILSLLRLGLAVQVSDNGFL